MPKKEENLATLTKLDKLLDRIENELKKKREDKTLSHSEKFIEHMKKTTDVYALVTEEVIGSLYILGHLEHTNLLRKLFKGIQQQVKSVLQFSLKYYNRKNRELSRNASPEGKDEKQTPKMEESIFPNLKHNVQFSPLRLPLSQNHIRTGSRGVRQRPGEMSPTRLTDTTDPRSLELVGSFKDISLNQNFQSPTVDKTIRRPNHSIHSERSIYSSMGPQRRNRAITSTMDNRFPMSTTLTTLESEPVVPVDPKEEEKEEQMKKNIEELLEGKKILDRIAPSEAASNSLKQVLKGLEGFTKKVKALGVVEIEESDEEPQTPNVNGMTSTILGAFQEAQKKTASKTISYFQASEKRMRAATENNKASHLEMLENEKKMRNELEKTIEQKDGEVEQLNQRILALEDDLLALSVKYERVSADHAACRQKAKPVKVKELSVGKEKGKEEINETIEEVKRGSEMLSSTSKSPKKDLKRKISRKKTASESSGKLQAIVKENKPLEVEVDEKLDSHLSDKEDEETTVLNEEPKEVKLQPEPVATENKIIVKKTLHKKANSVQVSLEKKGKILQPAKLIQAMGEKASLVEESVKQVALLQKAQETSLNQEKTNLQSSGGGGNPGNNIQQVISVVQQNSPKKENNEKVQLMQIEEEPRELEDLGEKGISSKNIAGLMIEEGVVNPETPEKLDEKPGSIELEIDPNIEQSNVFDFNEQKIVSSKEIETLLPPESLNKQYNNQEVQTSFSIEELLKLALQNGSIDISALLGIDKQRRPQNEGGSAENHICEDCPLHSSQTEKQPDKSKAQQHSILEVPLKKELLKGSQSQKDLHLDRDLLRSRSNLSRSGRTFQISTARNIESRQFQRMLTTDESKLSSMSISVTTNEQSSPKKIKQSVLSKILNGSLNPNLSDQIKRAEEFEKNNPNLTTEEAQTRAMYKSMLYQTRQDPKLMNLFRNFVKDKGGNVEDEQTFVADFATFQDYVKKFKEVHVRCGEDCAHLQRFYKRIGYFMLWNHRVPYELKKPDINNERAKQMKKNF